LEIINLYTSEFKNIPSIDKTLANRYRQQVTDIQEWLSLTRWSQEQLQSDILKTIQETLLQLDLIATIIPSKKILR